MSQELTRSARCLLRFTFALLIVLAPRNVLADGWKVQLQGVKALGLSYAGRSIFLDDASTVWFNAAGMSRLEKPWTITTAAPFTTYRLDYTDRGSTSLLGLPSTGEPTANGGRSAAVPHVYVVRKFNDRWAGGFGFNAPFGLGSDYGETWIGRYHATKSELTVINMNPAVAVRLNDRVSVGVGLDIQKSDAHLANMIDFGSFGALLGLPLAPQQHDGRIEFEGGDWGIGYDLSVAWTISSQVRFGATYRSQIEHTLEGTADFSVPSAAAPLTVGGALFADTAASAVLPMPHELSGSLAYDLTPKWVLVGDATWTDWSRFQRLVVTFENPLQTPLSQEARFEDSLRGAVGVIYRANSTWDIRAGALYETTPVPDATRTPRLPEGNNSGFSAGTSFKLGDHAEIDFSYSHLLPHEVPILLNDPAAGRLTGDVRWRLDILGVSLSLRF